MSTKVPVDGEVSFELDVSALRSSSEFEPETSDSCHGFAIALKA